MHDLDVPPLNPSEIQFRRATRRDVPFITSSWLKSYRDGYAVRGIPNNIYYYNQHKILEVLLPRAIVLVACNAEDPDQILAWCCAEVMDTALVLHYLYVKHPFRGFGLSRKLTEMLLASEKPPIVMYTHKTLVAKNILKEKARDWVYNPFLLFTTLPDGWNREEDSPSRV